MIAIPETALGFFQQRLRKFFEIAEQEPAFTELMYENGRTSVDIGGKLRIIEDSDLDDAAVLALASNASVFSDGNFSRENPSLSVVVPPDWRVSCMRPPVVDRPIMSMRKLRRLSIPMARYVEDGIMTESQAEHLKQLVRTRKTVVISGETGSGKTTLLRTLLGLVDSGERIITIEDRRELILSAADGSPRPHYVAMVAVKGVREMDALLVDALTHRPDRIIVGEVRGPEALELIVACNTGHRGGLFTVHSNGAEDAIQRLHTAAVRAQSSFPLAMVRRAIDVVVQITGHGERRKVEDIWENPHA